MTTTSKRRMCITIPSELRQLLQDFARDTGFSITSVTKVALERFLSAPDMGKYKAPIPKPLVLPPKSTDFKKNPDGSVSRIELGEEDGVRMFYEVTYKDGRQVSKHATFMPKDWPGYPLA